MEQKIEQLSFESIKEASKKYENINEVIIKLEINGEVTPFKVEMYRHFSPVAIRAFLAELVTKMDRMRLRNKQFIDSFLTPYIMFLSIKHFTTLKLPDNYDEQIFAIRNMLNTGALIAIYGEFEPTEIEGLMREIELILETFKTNEKELDNFKASMKDKLNNPDLLN